MAITDLYHAIEAACFALSPILKPVVEKQSSAFGLTAQEMVLLFVAPIFEPECVSASLLNRRSPYTSPDLYRKALENLANGGMLSSRDGVGFCVTEQGLETIRKVNQSLHETMAGIQPLPITRMMDLASRLKDLADACLETPEPPGNWCIKHARRLDPGRKAPMMARVNQFLEELIAFRDDAHLAAWQGYEENGHAREVLTYLWVEKQAVLGIIHQSLSYRGFSLEDTLSAASELIRKGWVSREGDLLRITPFGREIRRTIEATTDRYYFTPLICFSTSDLEQTEELIKEFRKGMPIMDM